MEVDWGPLLRKEKNKRAVNKATTGESDLIGINSMRH